MARPNAVTVAVIVAAASVSVLALSAAWSLTTRTTAVESPWGVVYRENLLTGHGEFCAVVTGGNEVRCVAKKEGPALDFSDRAR